MEKGDVTMLEFFSGIGGMRLAVEAALRELKLRNLASCQAYDISLYANQMYKHNIDDNVSTRLVEQLKELPEVDLWTMSPPCQPFTTTRGSKSLDLDDARCAGLKGIMRLLSTARQKPRWIFLENVQGFASSQMCAAWKDCLRENGYGYQDFLLSPVQFGVPNNRLRYYMLCELDSTRWKSEDLETRRDENGLSIDRIIREPPPLSHHSSTVRKRTIGEYVDSSLTEEDLQSFVVPLTALEKPWAKHLGVAGFGDTESHCFTAGYGRILSRSTGSLLLFRDGKGEKTNNLIRTVAEVPIDRSDMTRYRGRLRRFTSRELLRLFGFPKSFSFPPDISRDHQYKLIGNSINVVVVSELLKLLLHPSRGRGDGIVDHRQEGFRDSAATITGDVITIGGSKGHVHESITGNILQLYQSFRWKPLPNCTGRYTCRDHKLVSQLAPLTLLLQAGIKALDDDGLKIFKVYSFNLPGRIDRVLVVPLDDLNKTGLITFEKLQEPCSDAGTSYVHTLNSHSGFRRKLNAIGILGVTDDDIRIEV